MIIIRLTKGYTTIVDDVDEDLIRYSWYAECRDGIAKYAVRTKLLSESESSIVRNIRLHRVVLARILGRDLEDKEKIDHIDRDGLNNMRGNLRLASPSLNGRNRNLFKNNTSGCRGVTSDKHGLWSASIRINGIHIYIGTYATILEAYKAYLERYLEAWNVYPPEYDGTLKLYA
jgi:hypothetical protein